MMQETRRKKRKEAAEPEAEKKIDKKRENDTEEQGRDSRICISKDVKQRRN